MWRSITDTVNNVQSWANEKINGENSTAEYYNPIGQEENCNDNDPNYASPNFNSKHLADVRFDRALDAGIMFTEKLADSNVSRTIIGAVTGNGQARPNFNNKSQNKTFNRELATDLSKQMQYNKTQPPNNTSNIPKSNHQKVPGELTFVFHNTHTDTEERVSHDFVLDPRPINEEIIYTISQNDNIIAQRLQFPKFLPFDTFLNNSKSYLEYGDLLEFSSENKKSHWIVYLGAIDGVEMCIHHSKRLKKVTIQPISSVVKDRQVRRSNGVYTFTPKSIDQIKKAVTQIDSQNEQTKARLFDNFTSSETFGCWVRFQQDCFIKKNVVAENDCYKLVVDFGPGNVETQKFNNLSQAINKVRIYQREGKSNILNQKMLNENFLFTK